jgi:hypothetical protein
MLIRGVVRLVSVRREGIWWVKGHLLGYEIEFGSG